MAKNKNKVAFNVLAMAKMIKYSRRIKASLKAKGWDFEKGLSSVDDFINQVRRDKSAGKMHLSMRQVFRDEVLTNPDLLKIYQEILIGTELEENSNIAVQLKVNITGSGSKTEIIDALETLVISLKGEDAQNLADGIEWEDSTLMTEISEEE